MPNSVFERTPSFYHGSGKGRSNKKSGHVPGVEVYAYKYGLVNYPEPQEIPRGAASNALNFLTRGTKIEVRPGYQPYGAEILGTSKAFVFTAHRWDGTEIVFKASGNSLYYDSDGAGTWVECGSNALSGNAGENIYFDEYTSPAGAQLWISSTHSDLIKIMTANPGSPVSQYDASRNFRGTFKIKKNRMLLWNYLGNSIAKATKNTLQGSFIDNQTYTTVTNESIGTGDGIVKTFTGTLSQRTGKRTIFAITTGGGTETFVDDYMGNLVGTAGGTGTINYATGAFSITYVTAPANLAALTATYQYEDATQAGIADFTKSGTRTAGQGFALPQNDGGAIKCVMTLDGTEYVIHERKAWVVNIPLDDTLTTQEIFRDRLGLSSETGAVATADGIYYIDTTRKPYVAILTIDPLSSATLPKDLSSSILDLTGFVFDQCLAFEWDVYIIFCCRTSDSTVNNRMILLNREISGADGIYVYDLVDYYASSLAVMSGSLLAGDSVSATVFQLFANYDDNGAIPNCTWSGNIDDYGIGSLKRARQFWFEGEIDINQSSGVFISTDRGADVQIGTITGTGQYVDLGQAVTLGSLILGYNPLGGGSDGKTSFHYELEIRARLGKYQSRKISFQPTGLGYFSVSKTTDHDIVFHQDKLPARYRAPR